MSYGDHSPTRIPMYLEASNKDNLMKMMVANNIANAKSYNYQTPARDGKKWVVWYYGIIGHDNPIKEKDIDKIPTDIGLIDVEDKNGESEQ